MIPRVMIAVVATSLLSGCSIFGPGGDSNFACPGMPKGVTCKSPREIYNLSLDGKASSKSGKKSKGYNPGPVEVTFANGDNNFEPIPILEQARVMRIWISPWKDSNNDMHWPGLVFTKIKGDDWAIGNNDFNGIEPKVPRRLPNESTMPSLPRDVPPAQQTNQTEASQDVLN